MAYTQSQKVGIAIAIILFIIVVVLAIVLIVQQQNKQKLVTTATNNNNQGSLLSNLLPMVGNAKPVKAPKVGKAMEQPVAPTYRVGVGRRA